MKERDVRAGAAGSRSLAQIAVEHQSLRGSMVLVGLHEQTHTSDLADDALAVLQRRPAAARVVVDLV